MIRVSNSNKLVIALYAGKMGITNIELPVSKSYNTDMKETGEKLRGRTGGNAKDNELPRSNTPGPIEALPSQASAAQNIYNLITNDVYLKQIVENIEHVLWLRDIDSGQVLYVSPAFETVWGHSCKSLYADPEILIESVHPEDRVQVMVASSQNNHKPIEQVYRILRQDGSMRWVLARTFLVHDETREPKYQFCIARDITSQRKIELTQQKTLDRIREQFDLSHKMSLARKPEMVLEILMSVRELRTAWRASLVFFESPEAAPIHGIEVAASWSSNQNVPAWLYESNLYEDPAFLELLHPKRTISINEIETSPRLTPAVRDILRDAQIQSVVMFPLIALGDWLGSLLVYFDHETQLNHVELQQLKVLIDQATITLFNLKLLEAEKESRQEAERANEIKTEFLAMISHELRTPLTSIIGFTTTLLAEDVTWEPSEQHEFIQTIQQEADRLQELIDHLLDLSRLEAGKLPILLKPNLLHVIIDDALPQLKILTRDHTLAIHLPEDFSVFVDAKRIAQVLVNLVRNASTYAPKKTEIKITANVRGDCVQVNVTDQGPGIPVRDHKKVFKAFLRGKNEENGFSKGAGLGLAICKGLVEAHGGHIWIKKTSITGTTVSFTIPRDTTRVRAKAAQEEF
jgi:PAS domain S-box-containing protein